MSATPHRWETGTLEGLHTLSLDLAAIDPTRPEAIGQEIVEVVANRLHADRVSLLLLDSTAGGVSRAFSYGFVFRAEEWKEAGKVVGKVCSEGKPLLVYDIREVASLVSPWPASYKTDTSAVLPIALRGRIGAVLCISNLSSHQLLQLENSPVELELISSQIGQLCAQIEMHAESPVSSDSGGDEIALLGQLIERLERSMDMRSAFTIFCELVEKYLHVDMVCFVHDRFREPQAGVICIQRPVHQSESDSIFSELARQWQRRHKRAPLLNASDALVFGGELIKSDGDCPEELKLERNETFPVFIDNDLFALVNLCTDSATAQDRRRLKVFSVLVHHLMLHVKKSLLLEQNQEMQTVDSLTGLYSERHFYQMMEREFDRTARYNVPLNLLIIDVDHFKDVNEAYGYETGDLLLQEISRIAMENVRNTDLVSRYGGERFIVVLPETHYKNSEVMANRLRRFVENTSFFIPNTNVFIKVTVSIGVASYLDHRPASLAQFIEYADTALYFAKRNGRNRAVGYGYVMNLMMGETDNQG